MSRAEKSVTRLQYEANCHDYRGDVGMVSMLSSLILSSTNVLESHPILKTIVNLACLSSVAEILLSNEAYIRKVRKIMKKHDTCGEVLPEVSVRHFFTRRNLYRSPSLS